MNKLILSDLDFTLLRSDLTISNYTKDIWNQTAQKNKLSIATARSYTGVKELLKGLSLNEPLILLDGTLITSPSGDVLHMSAIDKTLGDEIIDIVNKNLKVYPLIVAYTNKAEEFFYPHELNSFQMQLLQSMKNRKRVFEDRELRAKEKNLKIVYLTSKEDAIILTSILKDNFENIEIKSSKDPYIDCYFTTILDSKGDKAHALKKLEEIEETDFNHTTVFGDSHNDIALFKEAKTKIAVANAIDELKALATVVLPYSNDEDGVAKYLEEIYIK